MGEGFQFLDIILFAMIAGFLVLRLRSVLGRRGDFGGSRHDPFSVDSNGDTNEGDVVQPKTADDEDQKVDEFAGSPLQSGFMEIKMAAPQFDPK